MRVGGGAAGNQPSPLFCFFSDPNPPGRTPPAVRGSNSPFRSSRPASAAKAQMAARICSLSGTGAPFGCRLVGRVSGRPDRARIAAHSSSAKDALRCVIASPPSGSATQPRRQQPPHQLPSAGTCRARPLRQADFSCSLLWPKPTRYRVSLADACCAPLQALMPSTSAPATYAAGPASTHISVSNRTTMPAAVTRPSVSSPLIRTMVR